MARRKDQSGKLLAWIIILSVASAVWTWLKETYAQLSVWASANWHLIAAIGAAVFFGFISLVVASNRASAKEHRARVDALRKKYGDEDIVRKVLNNEYWLGASEDMLLDSLGSPDDKDSEVMKTKTKETWKYGKKQANQYRLRIYLDNGRVTKWEHKG